MGDAEVLIKQSQQWGDPNEGLVAQAAPVSGSPPPDYEPPTITESGHEQTLAAAYLANKLGMTDPPDTVDGVIDRARQMLADEREKCLTAELLLDELRESIGNSTDGTDPSTESGHVEWAVVSGDGHFSNMGRPFASLAAAHTHMKWNRLVRRPAMKAEADEEQMAAERTGRIVSTAARFRWRQEEPRTYKIVCRRVTAWVDSPTPDDWSWCDDPNCPDQSEGQHVH